MKVGFTKPWIDVIHHRFMSFPTNTLPILSDDIVFTKTSQKSASVLVPLCNRHGVASLLYTIRSNKVGTHKGHVSFPGGHIDSNETAEEAAIREFNEELGPNSGNIQKLGIAQTIPAVTGTMVTPIIGYLDYDVLDFENFNPSEHEVAKLFTVPITKLLDPNFRQVETLSRQGHQYAFPYFGTKGDSECIWGLTGIITDAVLKELIQPTI